MMTDYHLKAYQNYPENVSEAEKIRLMCAILIELRSLREVFDMRHPVRELPTVGEANDES